MNQSFLFFELIGIFIVHWLFLEPQTYVVVEQFGAENIPLLSGRLVLPYLPSKLDSEDSYHGHPLAFLKVMKSSRLFEPSESLDSFIGCFVITFDL